MQQGSCNRIVAAAANRLKPYHNRPAERLKNEKPARTSAPLFVVKDKQQSIAAAFSGANKIILACVCGPLDLSTEDAVEGWCGTLCAECFLHSWVTNPRDVIATLTRCFFCALYPADKEQIKAGATMEILCAFFPRLLIRCFIYFDFAFLVLLLRSAGAKWGCEG